MERIRRIPIEKLIDALKEIYDSGVDFVDISKGISPDSEESDSVLVSYTRDYINPEYIEEFDKYEAELIKQMEEQSKENVEIKFSDEDINDII